MERDDGVRAGVTAESLGKIKPAFAKNGSIHGGNASQISDGAAAVLLMKRSTAEKLGQKIIGICGFFDRGSRSFINGYWSLGRYT